MSAIRLVAAVVAAVTSVTTAHADEVASYIDRSSCGAPWQAHLRIDDVKGAESLDGPDIRRYLRRNLPKLTDCYEKERLVRPDLTGAATIELLIDAAGTVKSATTSDALDEALWSCVHDVLVAIQLPKPKGGGVVRASARMRFLLGETGGFDAAECDDLPKPVLKATRKLAAALDAGKTKSFVSLLATNVTIDGARKGRAAVKKAISAAGGLAAWSKLTAGPWHLLELGEGRYMAFRAGYEPGLGFVLGKVKGAWRVVEIGEACELGADTCNL